jgi:TolB-like protein
VAVLSGQRAEAQSFQHKFCQESGEYIMQGSKRFAGAGRANWLRGLALWAAGLTAVAALSGCASIESSSAPQVSRADTWAVLPIVNYTETPQAGLAAEAITQSLLTSAGFTHVTRYPANLNRDTLVEPSERSASDKALDWARKEHVKYAVSGAVEEWRYKVGVDGEPAAGMTLQVIDVQSGAVVWSATGNRTGWSRSSLSSVGQKLIAALLAPVTRQ